MIHKVDIPHKPVLNEYDAYPDLKPMMEALLTEAERTRAALEGRTVWMVNSTETGGGVAEMLPKLTAVMRELGIRTQWVVAGSDDPRFFALTKRIHNLLHGEGDPHFTPEERALYRDVSRRQARALRPWIGSDDILVVHDPQPLAMGAMLKEELAIPALWRCHIGLDVQTPETEAAWVFLEPWALRYDRAVFTTADYAPAFLAGRTDVIHPAIDPLSPKNRDLTVHQVAGILHSAGLMDGEGKAPTVPFESLALRLQTNGSFAPALLPDDLHLMTRPIVTQVSRWDRLKGWAPLLKGFVLMKERADRFGATSEMHRNRLDLVRLVLAGPDPRSVHDDPEGKEVFDEICSLWLGLPPEYRKDVAVLLLPMASRTENALMVNALQRCSTVVAQNSLREGFGLTVTEALWKGCPVMGTHAAGIREQMIDGEHGRLVADPQNPEEIAATLDSMLASSGDLDRWRRNARKRAAEHFLLFAQVSRWLRTLKNTTGYFRQAA